MSAAQGTVEQLVGDKSSDRVAIVTGASSGIGRASAIALSSAGWKVVLSARRESELHATASECRWETLVVPGDISKEEAVVELFAKTIEVFGRVDLLFNNAGMTGGLKVIDELALEDFRSVLDINVVSSFLCSREAFKIFKKQGTGGRIINNGSLAAHTPRLHSAAYTISKHAITGLTKSTALDGREHNITCTQIDIGNAATDLAKGHSTGALQADGTIKKEPMLDVSHVADTIVHVASLPVSATVLYLNIMATGMPYVGRG